MESCSRFYRKLSATFAAIALLLSFVFARAADKGEGSTPSDQHYTVYVYDADLKSPIELARVVLRRDHAMIGQQVTNQLGITTFLDISSGWYRLSVHFIGYDDLFDSVLVDDAHSIDSVGLHETNEEEVVVTGEHELGVTAFDVRSGNQLFDAETYHAPPTARMTNLVQQNMMGAARAPTGELHIRGMHGEFTYYIDGIPIPLGVFGGLNEVVDPRVIDRATFLVGGFPAEYGGQMAAVIDIQNRVPPGKFHLDASTYGGSYYVPAAGDTLGGKVGSFKALNSNGQSLSLSTHQDRVGIFLSGSRQETDRRIDPPVAPLYHDHGFDYFLYGKIDFELSDLDYLTLNLNYGKTYTQVPYDSAEGITEDLQNTSNAFQTLSYIRTLSTEKNKESELFVGAFAREGGLTYTPGAADVPSFQFAGDTTGTTYNVNEDRSFTTLGTRIKYYQSLMHELNYSAGLNFSSTNGKENFSTTDGVGNFGPGVNTAFAGSDFGIFGEVEVHPVEWTRVEAGLRYDQHIAPGAPFQSQVSPRVRLNLFFDEFNSAYFYYGRLFMPTNIEGLRTIGTIAGGSEAAGQPPLPERDDIYEVGYTRSFASGLRTKVDYFHKSSSPGLDDATIGSSAIKTPINIQRVSTTGIEAGLSYSDPVTPFSGYLNAAIIHAYGSGPITGGFVLHDISDNDGDATDLDHDQRLSVVWSVNYQPRGWFANLTGIYGSGLTNGNPNGVAYQKGLFDFNTATHTSPSWILDLSFGYAFFMGGGATLEPSLYVNNLLDHEHLIKGAYFSGASYEERRNVVFKLSIHV
jgi:hypothetical protein